MAVRALPRSLGWHRLLVVAAWTVIVLFWVRVVFVTHQWDAAIYWQSRLDSTLYAGTWNAGADAFVYPPPFAQLIAPLTALPWVVFAGLWAAMNLGLLAWMLGPIAAAVGVIVFHPFGREVELGQVNLLIAAAMLAGLRYPAAWAGVVLTKVTPAITMLWHPLRGEWQAFGNAILATSAVCMVSYALAPDLWIEWGRMMIRDAGAGPHPDAIMLIPLPLWLRLLVAVGIVVWAARTDRPWALFVAAFVAMPLATLGRASVMAGAVYLLRKRRPDHHGVAWPYTRPRRATP